MSIATKHIEFEHKYLAVRAKENRVYQDDQVKQLPFKSPVPEQVQEWQVRTKTLNRFLHYLSGKKISRVLDLGCGNGWFTYQVATHLGNAKVLGGDVNQEELDQAERCFQRPNLSFKPIDIFEFETDQLFDLITINAAVQYFPSIKELLGVIQPLLAPGGEFHILDSPVYENLQAATAAKQRTTDYYAKMGVPMMSEHYFHHTKDDFQSFVTKYQPSRNRLIKKLLQPSPFPWLVYQKEDE